MISFKGTTVHKSGLLRLVFEKSGLEHRKFSYRLSLFFGLDFMASIKMQAGEPRFA